MAVEIKETTESAVENAVENVTMGADLVTGAAVTVAENVTRAVSHPVREARKIERRGAAANKRFGRDVADFVEDTTEGIDAIMPEKVALLGIHAIKDRARRKDLMGDIAYRTLELVNGGLEAHPHPPGAACQEGRPHPQANRRQRDHRCRQERPARHDQRPPDREEALKRDPPIPEEPCFARRGSSSLSGFGRALR